LLQDTLGINCFTPRFKAAYTTQSIGMLLHIKDVLITNHHTVDLNISSVCFTLLRVLILFQSIQAMHRYI